MDEVFGRGVTVKRGDEIARDVRGAREYSRDVGQVDTGRRLFVPRTGAFALH
jgi:hypothetical protein